MSDSPTTAILKEISRTLKEISSSLKEQNRIQKTRASTVTVHNPASEPAETLPESDDTPRPRNFGWSMAASVQREGGLNRGDLKIEYDNSQWVWTGEGWERFDDPAKT